MLYDVWIVVPQANWDAIAPAEEAEVQPWHRAYKGAITGFWKTSVYNVIGYKDAIDALLDELTGVTAVYAWTQGTGTDDISEDGWPTDPAPILALMNENVTYDENGDVVSTTPATYENPKWGHVFLGQQQRIFAGEFSDEFSEEFL